MASQIINVIYNIIKHFHKITMKQSILSLYAQ